jgi:cytochrome c biogenesis protein CcmG/thiol:disulfide interchange protein DsbE
MTATAGEPVAGSAAKRGRGRLPRTYYAAAALVPILLLAAWGALQLARPAAPSIALIGQPAPGFVLADLNGNPLRLEDLRGRPVIVNFWASWCGPCVEEFPLLLSAATAHRADGLAVVGIVFRDRSEAARGFMSRMGATWPAAMDPGDGVAAQFGIIGPPDTFFIDRNGLVVGRQIGQLSSADLQRGLNQILGVE